MKIKSKRFYIFLAKYCCILTIQLTRELVLYSKSVEMTFTVFLKYNKV